jgi:uncharacterized protein (TIRG00374 family)
LGTRKKFAIFQTSYPTFLKFELLFRYRFSIWKKDFRYNFKMRRIIIVFIFVLGILLAFFRHTEIITILTTLEHSDWRFWGLGLLVELIWLYHLGFNYRVLYRLMSIEESGKHLFWLASAANFINVVAPTAGIGGIALFMDDAKKRNQPTGRITVIGALFVLYDYLAFLILLALGWIVLLQRNNLNPGEMTASLIMLGLSCGLAMVMFLGYKSGDLLGNALTRVTRLINHIFQPFIHKNYLLEENAIHFGHEIADGLLAIRGKKKQLLWPFLFALINKILLLIILALTFRTFQIPFTIGTLIAGLSIAYLFVIVSPTPAGVGFVEGALALTLNTMRVPLGSAAVIAITFRAITFWFPLLVGAYSFRHLRMTRKSSNLLNTIADKMAEE